MKTLQLGLPPNEDEIASLKNQLTVSPVRGTDFIEITAKHPSQKQAVLIANAVAQAYLTRSAEIERHRTDRALEALDEEIQEQVKLVEKCQADLDKFRSEHQIDEDDMDIYRGTTLGAGTPDLDSPVIMKWTEALMKKHPDKNPTEITLLQNNFALVIEEFDQTRDMLTEMMIKHQDARLLFKTPKAFITIHQPAQ